MLRQQKERNRNKARSRQVFSLATRSRFASMRERHAPKSSSIQSRQVVLRPSNRNSNDSTFTPCGRRIGDRCCSFLAPGDCSCRGISVVRVAGKLSLLLLQNSGAMSVAGLRHRRLRVESAFTFPEQTARFRPENSKPVQNLLSRTTCMPEIGDSEGSA